MLWSGLYGYVLNDPLNYLDPSGEYSIPRGGSGGGEAAAGIGDLAVMAAMSAAVCNENKKEEAEHTKNKRPSTKEKHQKGQARKSKDKGGEKGDARRPYRRK